ncbi:glycosyltransferase family 4 protein [Mesorhizobium sp.]|uniref:glycosyltransferase family 4 protein n=1 Tax=Mesorhizobium sp. TaxID=1871066 RepID=UPI00257F971A|nr:glycosyltransferase family 4 protein [Mesorhizobium sp.]
MERHIAALTIEQRRQGCDVVPVYNAGVAKQPAVRVLSGINLRSIKPAALRDFAFYSAAISSIGPTHDNKIAVVHVHGDYSAFLAARMLAWRLKASMTIATLHESAIAAPMHYRVSMMGYGLVLATGWKEAQHLEKILGRQVHHLPSAPLDTFFDPSEAGAPCDVITVGSLVPRKRTELVLACAARLPHLRFSIYGEGIERRRLEALSIAMNCQNVAFHGGVSSEKIAAALRGARVFLSVSATEGTPTAALEAMAAGLPVVLTPSNDYSWLIRNDVNGYVTSGWEIEDVTCRLVACLADEDRRRMMGKANRAIAETHRWNSKARFLTERVLDCLEVAKP